LEKHIYLIRHGETDFNKQGVVQGRGVDSELNANGKLQSRLFYEAYRHVGIEKVYISNLKRTFQTVEPFASAGIPVEKHTGLDEISWGIHEGQHNGASFKQFYEILHLWKQGEIDRKIEGGESPLDVQQRQLEFLPTLIASPEKNILICSHGRAMRILLCTVMQQHLKEMDAYPHHNLGLYKLNLHAGVFRITLFNEIRHVQTTL